MRPITVASLFVYNQHDKGGERERQEFQHLLHKICPFVLVSDNSNKTVRLLFIKYPQKRKALRGQRQQHGIAIATA